MDPASLTQVLRDLPNQSDPNLLVGSASADDAGIYKLSDELALVQTLDFFTPITDDPYTFGQIAAANALSDVYAMGGRPITAMAIAGMPTEHLSNDEISEIFKGGAEMVQQANCSLVGGHTIKNPEPIYGLSVTGTVHPDKFSANAHAREGDVLILTKPIGTGIITTAHKKSACSQELHDAAIENMISLNTAGADLGEKNLINACTDVTGFGFLGHLIEVAAASELTAEIRIDDIPAISPDIIHLIEANFVPGGSKQNLESMRDKVKFSEVISEAQKLLLADAQTSGGLLLSVAPENLEKVHEVLAEHHTLCAAEVGTMEKESSHLIRCS